MTEQSITREAAQIALEELRAVRAEFNDETTEAARLKVANASIRLVQCMTRTTTSDPDLPTTETQGEPETRA